MSTYENAPATKLLATNCACCGRALVDAVSVETGIGPDCREKYGVSFEIGTPAHDEANALVHEVARKGVSKERARQIFDRIAALGFVVLAERIAKRFRTTLTPAMSEEEIAAHRAAYGKLRAAFCYDNCNAKEFDALVKAMNPEGPAEFVTCAAKVECRCGRCGGTGRYVIGAENGAPKFGGGDCFRCGGKGYQNADDVHRNRAYDKYAVNRAARAMFAA